MIFSWNRRTIMPAASRHSGMLTKKIQRHDTYSEKTPPSAGPMTAAAPHTLAT